jgi:hypothetical protein
LVVLSLRYKGGMPVSLEDLVALVKERGTPNLFPQREELHGLLEPFRALRDQESVQLALAATVRKGDRLVARVGSEALAYLGGDAAPSLLIAIAMDASLGTSQRAAAVWALEHQTTNFHERLTPDEQVACLSLPVFEMLEDPEADHGFGLQALLDSYREFPPHFRSSFLKAIAELARDRKHNLASLCMHLLGAEEDGERRSRLLDLAAADVTQEAADLLAAFAAKTEDPQEAKLARRHLHVLRAKGLRGTVHQDMEAARALVTGVDGDACFAVNIIIPRLPTFDFANLLLHYENGLRDGFVMQNLPSRSVDELVEKITKGCGNLAAFVPMPLAARMIDDAVQSSKPKTLSDGNVVKAMALAEPALAKARTQPFVEPAAEEPATTTPEEVDSLLDSESFESWFFEARENTVQESLALLDKSVRSQSKSEVANRLAIATKNLCKRLCADDEPARLERMLRHQARLFECLGQGERAKLCRKLAMEVKKPESVFLAQIASRSLIAALEAPPEADRGARLVEAREHLRGRISGNEREHRKVDVIHLDISAVAHVELNIRNREEPSSRRASLATIEVVSLAVGDAFVEHVLGPSGGAGFSQAVAKILDTHDLFPSEDRVSIARETITSIADFVKGICGDHCPHRCLQDLQGDGRIPYYIDGLPWEAPAPSHRRPPTGQA